MNIIMKNMDNVDYAKLYGLLSKLGLVWGARYKQSDKVATYHLRVEGVDVPECLKEFLHDTDEEIAEKQLVDDITEQIQEIIDKIKACL